MSMDGMKDVEVPISGTVVVQDGDVHDVKEYPSNYEPCWCKDGRHAEPNRGYRTPPQPDYEPHLVGVQLLELVWEVKK